MKIAYVNSCYGPPVGGASHVVQLQAQALAARGHEVSVLCVGASESDQTHSGNVRVLQVRAARSAQLAREATALLFSLAPDVVCYHDLRSWSPAVWGSAQTLGLPSVQVLRDAYLLCPSATMFVGAARCTRQCWSCRALRWRHVRASQRLDAVIGASCFILEKALDAGLFAGVACRNVLYDCSAARLPAARVAARAVRAAPLRLGCVGALAAHDGIELLLRSAQRLQHDGLELLVAVTGESRYARDLRQQFAGPTIRFVSASTVAELADSIDVCVVPSLWDEPWPRTIAEALGLGLPVIGARRGGIPEMIRHEFNGLLFDPCEAALAVTLQRLLAQPALINTLAANCRVSAARFHDLTTWATRHEAILQGAIATARLRSSYRPPMDPSLRWVKGAAAHLR